MNHQACLHISIEYARTHTHTHTNILVSPPQVHRSPALPRIGYNIPVTSSILRASFPGDPRSGRVRKLTSSLLSLLPVSIPVYTRLTLCYSSIFLFFYNVIYHITSTLMGPLNGRGFILKYFSFRFVKHSLSLPLVGRHHVAARRSHRLTSFPSRGEDFLPAFPSAGKPGLIPSPHIWPESLRIIVCNFRSPSGGPGSVRPRGPRSLCACILHYLKS